jgi:hypothetical protein
MAGGGDDKSTQGRGSEAGSGNEAHRAPGEGGQAEGQGYAERAYGDVQPDPNHPRSRSQRPSGREGSESPPDLPDEPDSPAKK